jgi:hypothetical protein
LEINPDQCDGRRDAGGKIEEPYTYMRKKCESVIINPSLRRLACSSTNIQHLIPLIKITGSQNDFATIEFSKEILLYEKSCDKLGFTR